MIDTSIEPSEPMESTDSLQIHVNNTIGQIQGGKSTVCEERGRAYFTADSFNGIMDKNLNFIFFGCWISAVVVERK